MKGRRLRVHFQLKPTHVAAACGDTWDMASSEETVHFHEIDLDDRLLKVTNETSEDIF